MEDYVYPYRKKVREGKLRKKDENLSTDKNKKGERTQTTHTGTKTKFGSAGAFKAKGDKKEGFKRGKARQRRTKFRELK